MHRHTVALRRYTQWFRSRGPNGTGSRGRNLYNKKAVLSQRWPHDAPGALKIFGTPCPWLYTPTATFPEIFSRPFVPIVSRILLWNCLWPFRSL